MTFVVNSTRNRRLSCRLAGCGINRAALSPYCPRHAKAVERYGHPEGRALDPVKDYGHERQLVAAFLAQHINHAGVQSALKWLQRWLDAAARGEDVPAQRDMARLGEQRVPPLSMLIEAAGLFLLSRWNRRLLADDVRLDFAIGYRVLSLAKREKRFGILEGNSRYYCRPIGKVARRGVGQRIRLNLAPLFVNLAEAIEAEREKREQFAASLNLPFTQGA